MICFANALPAFVSRGAPIKNHPTPSTIADGGIGQENLINEYGWKQYHQMELHGFDQKIHICLLGFVFIGRKLSLDVDIWVKSMGFPSTDLVNVQFCKQGFG